MNRLIPIVLGVALLLSAAAGHAVSEISRAVVGAGGGTLQTTAATGTGADNGWIISGNDMSAGVTGNVGIGTPTPQTKLHLSSTGYSQIRTLPGEGQP